MNEEKVIANVTSILADYRVSIDNIDAALVHMLAERFRCTKASGLLKATHDLLAAEDVLAACARTYSI
ncbi:chorismate mutase [Mesorhizobium sp. AR10]|nr:chorismate mutase [Mesorhizobium sp. AR10]